MLILLFCRIFYNSPSPPCCCLPFLFTILSYSSIYLTYLYTTERESIFFPSSSLRKVLLSFFAFLTSFLDFFLLLVSLSLIYRPPLFFFSILSFTSLFHYNFFLKSPLRCVVFLIVCALLLIYPFSLYMLSGVSFTPLLLKLLVYYRINIVSRGVFPFSYLTPSLRRTTNTINITTLLTLPRY